MDFGYAIKELITGDPELNNMVDKFYYLYYDDRNPVDTYLIYSYNQTSVTRAMGKARPVLENYTLYTKVVSPEAQKTYNIQKRLKEYLQSKNRNGIRSITLTSNDNAVLMEPNPVTKIMDSEFNVVFEP